MIVPKQLISILNSGRCIAFVGSGPSSEMGYPSWSKLAEKCLADARLAGVKLDEQLFERLTKKGDLLNVFQYLETAVTRSSLVTSIQSHLVPTEQEGKAYKLLASWPFRFYMTTNWDSEIKHHLSRVGQHYTEVSNSHTEITQITDETTKQIFKLHGVYSDLDSLVITENDYQSFKTSDQRRYFRETLKSVLRTLPAIVIGHSLTDPDIQAVLEAAKSIAPGHRPVYMIVGDPQREEIDSYRSRYNIQLIGYKKEPTYTAFYKLLSQIGKFVIPRASVALRTLDPPEQNEIEVATSLLVFNSLSKSIESPHLLDRLIRPQVLQQLKKSAIALHNSDFIPLLIPETLRTLPGTIERLEASLARLDSENLITGSDTIGWKLTTEGNDFVSTAFNSQRFEDDQVYGALRGQLENAGVSSEDCEKAAQSLKSAILSVFCKRGIAAASLVFRGQKFEPVDMAELFESVTTSISWADSFALREVFIEFAVRLFSMPTNEERRYLARISQGLFAVHVFGIDPASVDARVQVFKATSWFLDSNVLIHLLASGSTQHEMAASLCAKCKRLGIKLYASKGVVQESFNSLDWASRMCANLTAQQEMQFIYQVYNEDGYRPNPFIYGFVKSHQKNAVSRFEHYRRHLGITDLSSVNVKLAELGVTVVAVDNLPKDDANRNRFLQYKNSILTERERRGTSRGGEFQATVEAEILCLILAERSKASIAESEPRSDLAAAYFVSTSRLLDQMYGSQFNTLTWLPDVLFKHLSFVSPSEGDSESLIESMGDELAELGITLVDQDAYRQYFDPLISSTRMSFDQERAKYVEALKDESGASAEELQRDFDSTEDIGKPLFLSQLLWRVASKGNAQLERQLRDSSRQQEELSDKLKSSEEGWQKRQKETVQHYENRIRNLTDPVKRDKLMRKARNKKKRRK